MGNFTAARQQLAENDHDFAEMIRAVKDDAMYQAVAETVRNDYPSMLPIELEMIALKRFTEQIAASGDDLNTNWLHFISLSWCDIVLCFEK